jgi:hypothetical protein
MHRFCWNGAAHTITLKSARNRAARRKPTCSCSRELRRREVGVGWPCLYCGGYYLPDHCELGALSTDGVFDDDEVRCCDPAHADDASECGRYKQRKLLPAGMQGYRAFRVGLGVVTLVVLIGALHISQREQPTQAAEQQQRQRTEPAPYVQPSPPVIIAPSQSTDPYQRGPYYNPPLSGPPVTAPAKPSRPYRQW